MTTEQELLSLFRSLKDDQKKHLISYLGFLVAQNETEKFYAELNALEEQDTNNESNGCKIYNFNKN